MYYVYMLRCADNSIYTGVATDPERRFKQHSGETAGGAKYTAAHRPLRIECVFRAKGKSEALRAEYRIKQLTHIEKEQLISGSTPERLDICGCRRVKTTEEGRLLPMLFVCYKKCSTCRKAEEFLKSRGVTFELRDIKEDNPTEAELRDWHARSGLPLKRFFNTSGNSYKALGLADKLKEMSEDEQYALLASDGMLVRRPIVVADDTVLVGFKAAEWEEKL